MIIWYKKFSGVFQCSGVSFRLFTTCAPFPLFCFGEIARFNAIWIWVKYNTVQTQLQIRIRIYIPFSMALFRSAKLRDLRQFEFGSNFACYPPFPPRNILVAGFQGLQQKHFQKGVLSKHFPYRNIFKSLPMFAKKTDKKSNTESQ